MWLNLYSQQVHENKIIKDISVYVCVDGDGQCYNLDNTHTNTRTLVDPVVVKLQLKDNEPRNICNIVNQMTEFTFGPSVNKF